jgi:hypothetical protein
MLTSLFCEICRWNVQHNHTHRLPTNWSIGVITQLMVVESERGKWGYFCNDDGAARVVRCPARTRLLLLVSVCLLHGRLNRLQRVLICTTADQEALIQLFHPDAQQNNHLSLLSGFESSALLCIMPFIFVIGFGFV